MYIQWDPTLMLFGLLLDICMRDVGSIINILPPYTTYEYLTYCPLHTIRYKRYIACAIVWAQAEGFEPNLTVIGYICLHLILQPTF